MARRTTGFHTNCYTLKKKGDFHSVWFPNEPFSEQKKTKHFFLSVKSILKTQISFFPLERNFYRMKKVLLMLKMSMSINNLYFYDCTKEFMTIKI